MRLTTLRHAALTALTAATLAACGGGGGGDTPATTPTPPVAPAALTVSGTAATGRAVVGGAIAAKCATGTGSATTGADGRYSVSVSGGALPCVLRVTATDGAVLHSVAEGSGSSATANISPLTELIVAQAAGDSAASLFSSFDAAAQAKVSAAALGTATSAVAGALQGVVSLDGINPIKDALVAATASAAGNALDQKLDALGAALAAAQLSVADLGAAIVNNGAAAAAVVGVQVKPAAAHCAGLRSGDYVMINPNESEAPYRVQRLKIDAATLTVRLADGTWAGTGKAVAGRPCEFTGDEDGSVWIVSSAGLIVQRYLAQDGSNQPRLALALPVQAIGLADLAGTWNTVELFSDGGGGPVNDYSTVTVDAKGRITALVSCNASGTCGPDASLPQGFAVHAEGGFSATNQDGSAGRFFALRTASGDLVMAGLFPDGIMLGSKQKALALPAVGDTTAFWNVSVNSGGVASSLVFDVSTVSAVDAAAGSYTRSVVSTGQLDPFVINSPRNGLRQRAANSCKSSAGAAVNCSALNMLPLPGTGMAVYGSGSASNAFFGFSVNRPAGSTGSGTSSDITGPSGSGAAALGTLVWTGGETYPLRANLTITAAGQINGGGYDFHKLDGTMTACEYSPANAATCHGTSGNFNVTSQSGAISTAGANGVSLKAGPDLWGFTFTGTLAGTTWSGTWTKVATANSAMTGSGSFSVALGITVRN